MDSTEAFKIGFLSRCVEEGLSQEKTAELVEKGAGVVADAGKFLSEVGPKALMAALAAGPVLGASGAYLYNKATDVDATDVEEIKKKELADQYQRMAEQLDRQSDLRRYQQERKQKGQVFF
jgi:hypothetical protein